MLEKYQNKLRELKKIGRANAIFSWHKETLREMKLNLLELRKEKNIYVQ